MLNVKERTGGPRHSGPHCHRLKVTLSLVFTYTVCDARLISLTESLFPCAISSRPLFFDHVTLPTHVSFSFYLPLYHSIILYSRTSFPFVSYLATLTHFIFSIKPDLPHAPVPSLTFIPVSPFFHPVILHLSCSTKASIYI